MANHLSAEQWAEMKIEIQARWLDLSDQDLERTHGDYLKIVNLIEQKCMCNHQEASRSVEEVFEIYAVDIPLYQENVINAPKILRACKGHKEDPPTPSRC